VKVFGRGKVTSNIIVGMGDESDENVLDGVGRRSPVWAAVATLRPLLPQRT
jgi:hypothetical protein